MSTTVLRKPWPPFRPPWNTTCCRLYCICWLPWSQTFTVGVVVQSISCVQLFGACWAPLSMEFSWQEYWNRLPCPSLGGLPDPGIKPYSLTLQEDSLPTELPSLSIIMYEALWRHSLLYGPAGFFPFISQGWGRMTALLGSWAPPLESFLSPSPQSGSRCGNHSGGTRIPDAWSRARVVRPSLSCLQGVVS